MLDKSIAFKNIIMRMEADQVAALPDPALPDGYSFKLFRAGDEHHWARIETSVLEFFDTEAALRYFCRDYLPYLLELEERCVFIVDKNLLPIATATAWQADSRLGYQSSLHWVSVCPDYQGLGLGRAVVLKAMSILKEKDPGKPVWLHTQTWSHVAVRLYHSLGFNIIKKEQTAVVTNSADGVKISPNDYAAAMRVLEAVIEPDFLAELKRTAR